MHAFYFLLLAFVSEVLGTLAGFGSSTFFVPLAQLLEDFRTVLALTALLHVFSNASKLLLFGSHTRWRIALLFVAPGLVTVVVGARLTSNLDVGLFEGFLGAFLLLYGLVFLLRPHLRLPGTPWAALLSGALAGFVTGLLGTGGAIRAAGLMGFGLGKSTFVATSALADLFTDSGRAVVYLWQGYLSPDHYFYVPLLVGVAYVGSWVGRRILNRVSEERFGLLVRLLVVAIGAFMLLRALIATDAPPQ